MSGESRPSGGHKFDAVHVAPEGWLVLAPWVQTPDGYWWRPHLWLGDKTVLYEDGKAYAEHYAAAINEAMGVPDER